MSTSLPVFLDKTRLQRDRRIGELLRSTGLAPFTDRPAAKLSGGMKQKLGLCCALIHDPDLLILDEPTTGVDPLSRRQFWDLIDTIRIERPGMSVLVATAYMEEAERFDWLVAMDAGRVLATGYSGRFTAGKRAPALSMTPLSRCFPRKSVGGITRSLSHRGRGEKRRHCHRSRDLTMRFGDFTAVNRRQLPHCPRRDLRLSRLERLRQDHDDENAHGPASRERRERTAVWRARSTPERSRCCASVSATCRRPFRSIPN